MRPRSLLALSLASFLYVALYACGGRTLEDGSSEDADGDRIDATSAADGSTSTNDATSPFPSFDANIDTGVPAANCGICAVSKCGTQLLSCFNNPGCQAVVQCVTQTCLGGGGGGGGTGGFDNACFLTCAQKDIGGALMAGQILQCITQQCGAGCFQAIGSAGGGGFGGGGPNGGGGGGGGGPQ